LRPIRIKMFNEFNYITSNIEVDMPGKFITKDQTDRVRKMSLYEIENEIRDQRRWIHESNGLMDLRPAEDYLKLLYDIKKEKQRTP
jgi:hypothetical protein